MQQRSNGPTQSNLMQHSWTSSKPQAGLERKHGPRCLSSLSVLQVAGTSADAVWLQTPHDPHMKRLQSCILYTCTEAPAALVQKSHRSSLKPESVMSIMQLLPSSHCLLRREVELGAVACWSPSTSWSLVSFSPSLGHASPCLPPMQSCGLTVLTTHAPGRICLGY